MLRQVGLLTLAAITGRADVVPRAPLAFAEVYVCFAEEHAGDLVSGFGHVFVCLPERPARSADDLLMAPAVNFAADTSPLGEGAWVGRYRLGVCHELIRNNAFFQQRDVYFVRIAMDEASRRRLAQSLIGRLDRPFPYNFLRKNCGVRLAEWIFSALEPAAHLEGPVIYLTPREAMEGIMARVPPEAFFVYRSSASRVAMRASELGPMAVAQAKRAVKDISKTSDVSDPALRLDVIRLNESRASPEEFSRLQELKRDILSLPEGPAVARIVVASGNSGQRPMSEWVNSDEGPCLRMGLLHDGKLKAGVRLGFEAGLRDPFTAPVSSETRRVARILDLELDVFHSEVQTHFVLIGVHIDRDLPSVFGAGSSGFEIGYTDRLNLAGTSGLFVESWSGLALKLPLDSWISARVNLRMDAIHDHPRLRLLPSLSGSTNIFGCRFEADAVSDLGDVGCRFTLSRDFGHAVVSMGLELDPQGARRVELSASRRF